MGRSRAPVNSPPVVPSSGLALVEVVCLLDTFPALSGLTLSVGPGEIVAVEGPNGAGKTTLLRACAGLAPISGGSATVCGIDVRSDPRSVRRTVGYLGHRSLLYEDLTVEDNVRFAVESSRIPGSPIEHVRHALDAVGIDRRVARLALHSCSAGQRRRTALATVVARQPKVWLLDEPHASLDPDARDALDSLLRDAAASGATVLVVSHDPDRASSFATRRVVVAGGYVTNSQLVGAGPRSAEVTRGS